MILGEFSHVWFYIEELILGQEFDFAMKQLLVVSVLDNFF